MKMPDLWSRRTFVGSAAVAAGYALARAMLPAVLRKGAWRDAPSGQDTSHQIPQPPLTGARREPVVGYHMDRPYLDPTGLAEPYVAPAGTRSGQVLAELSESEFRSRLPYG